MTDPSTPQPWTDEAEAIVVRALRHQPNEPDGLEEFFDDESDFKDARAVLAALWEAGWRPAERPYEYVIYRPPYPDAKCYFTTGSPTPEEAWKTPTYVDNAGGVLLRRRSGVAEIEPDDWEPANV